LAQASCLLSKLLPHLEAIGRQESCSCQKSTFLNAKETSMKGIFSLFSAAALAAVFLATPSQAQPVESPNTAVYNTGQNVRDKAGDTITPMQQSESKTDIKLAADIRRAIVKDKRLSTSAKNVKIITDDGKVTLRGPVNTSREKTLIAAQARAIAGPGNVNDQLDVANQ
jgi:hyperosmotically inducible periplasmic protein